MCFILCRTTYNVIMIKETLNSTGYGCVTYISFKDLKSISFFKLSMSRQTWDCINGLIHVAWNTWTFVIFLVIDIYYMLFWENKLTCRFLSINESEYSIRIFCLYIFVWEFQSANDLYCFFWVSVSSKFATKLCP